MLCAGGVRTQHVKFTQGSAQSSRLFNRRLHLFVPQVIDGSRDVLLRIDKQYPYGDEHDAYKKVAEAVGTSSADLLVASLGVPTYGEDKENAEIAVRVIGCVTDGW